MLSSIYLTMSEVTKSIIKNGKSLVAELEYMSIYEILEFIP